MNKNDLKPVQIKVRRFMKQRFFEGYGTFLDKFVFLTFAAINAIGKKISSAKFKEWVYARLIEYLLEPLASYDPPLQLASGTKVEESLFLIYKKRRFLEVAEPGDVILIRGNMRISRIIQTLTHSPYSHAGLYLGNGEIVEAEPEGVLVSPIDKYIHLDIRISRPVMLTEKRTKILLDHIAEMIRVQPKYDITNIEKLLFKYIYAKFRPDVQMYIGGGSKFEAMYICSGLIAHGFHKAGYPIVPALRFRKKHNEPLPKLETISDYFQWISHGQKNYSQIVPADFDNSSFFATVKFMCLDSQQKTRRRNIK